MNNTPEGWTLQRWDNPVPMCCTAMGRASEVGTPMCAENATHVWIEDGMAVAFRCYLHRLEAGNE